MKQITHLERALQIIRSKKTRAAAAIVPLAIAAPVLADTVKFELGTTSIPSANTGGRYGKILNALLADATGVRLWGDTRPEIENMPWLTAEIALESGGPEENTSSFALSWAGALSGQVQKGDIFTVFHDFSINLGGTSPGTVSWALHAEAQTTEETLTYTLTSSDPSLGDFDGSFPQPFLKDGDGISWLAELSILWSIPTDGPLYDKTLQLDIPQYGSIDLSIAAVPVPPAIWMGGSILGVLAWVRRKAAKPA